MYKKLLSLIPTVLLATAFSQTTVAACWTYLDPGDPGYVAPWPDVIEDLNASIVSLRADCGAESNCTTSLEDLICWVNEPTRDRNTDVVVGIGPGEFVVPTDMQFCDNSNNMSFKGSGRDVTTLTGDGGYSEIPGNIDKSVLVIEDCNNLSFQDMTIRSDSWRLGTLTGSTSAISWDGDTNSHWSNVNVEAGSQTWYDNGGLHYFFGSKLHTKTSGSIGGSAAYYSEDGETWFYGGEIVSTHDSPLNIFMNVPVFMNRGVIQIFGASIRSLSTSAGSGTVNGFQGLRAGGGGSVHMHGGIIAVHGKNMPIDQNIAGIKANGQSTIHTPGTAFNISPGGNGTATRVGSNGGNPQSPFQWPASDAPPAVLSENGSDTFVETDCDDTGDCSGGGTSLHPHLMVYDDSCSAGGPWFDIVTGQCRQ